MEPESGGGAEADSAGERCRDEQKRADGREDEDGGPSRAGLEKRTGLVPSMPLARHRPWMGRPEALLSALPRHAPELLLIATIYSCRTV